MTKRSILCAILMVNAAGWVQRMDAQASVPAASQSTHATEAQSPAFKLPDPSGPFRIGRVGYEWIDPSRADIFAAEPGSHRALMVYFWYPASSNAHGPAEPYWPGAKQMDADLATHREMAKEFGALWPLIASGEFRSHAIEKASPAKEPAQFPVVLFSHGLGSTGFAYTSLIENLVSHGYVVVAVEHTYTAAAVTFPDGKVALHRDAPVPPGLTPDQRWKRLVEDATARISQGADDLVFVINKLQEMNGKKEKAFPLAGRLDLKHVAAAGQSAGGDFATRACELDIRFKACVSLDGEMSPVAAFPEYPDGKRIQQPVLLLEVDHSGERTPFSPAQYSDFLRKEEEQLTLCPKGSYHVLLKAPGLVHGSFSDDRLRVAKGDPTQTSQAIYNLHLTESFTLAFLDKSMKEEKEPLLDAPAQSAEAIVKEYGHEQ